MKYPTTGHEVYVSLNLSNTMLTGIGKGTITREEVSVDYLKDLFSRHGVIVSATQSMQRRVLSGCPGSTRWRIITPRLRRPSAIT